MFVFQSRFAYLNQLTSTSYPKIFKVSNGPELSNMLMKYFCCQWIHLPFSDNIKGKEKN